jgi:exonuclease VII small subunit
MEAEWEHKASNEAIQISAQVDKMTQLEHRVSTQAEEVFKVIREATAALNTLETKLTLAQDRIEEVDQAAEATADFIDASTVTK